MFRLTASAGEVGPLPTLLLTLLYCSLGKECGVSRPQQSRDSVSEWLLWK